MNTNSRINEKFLYEVWKNQNFEKTLTTDDGETIEVIDVGIENQEFGGPDFLNARIKIGNITFMGDVEIDRYITDWKSHGHFLNKRYNKVILHAVLHKDNNHNFVFTQDGRKVRAVCIEKFLNENLKTEINKAILSERRKRINIMPCSELNGTLSRQEKFHLIYQLGKERFSKKCERMLERLKEITYLKEMEIKEPVVHYTPDENFYKRKFTYEDFKSRDLWQQLLYELIFEALGYSKNKEIMVKLSRIADINFIQKFSSHDDFRVCLEAVLFKISGLITEDTDNADEESLEYLRTLTEHWNEVKPLYDGLTFNAEQWHFMKLRPQNFPTIRLAGGVRLLTKIVQDNWISRLLNSIEFKQFPNPVISWLRNAVIVKSDGYWKSHYIFGKRSNDEINYFIGRSRADEIIVNVILPFSAVYFEIFGRKNLAQKSFKIYSEYLQDSSNQLVNEVADTLKMGDTVKRSIIYQGIIELFRNFCSKDNCLECEIGKKIFA